MMELDLATRKATGKCVLKAIPDRTQRTLKEEIQRHIVPGSLIFTDSFASYRWLSKPTSGFVHRAVNHRKREFSRTEQIFGEDVVVSTNGAEGLFGRLKSYLRQRNIKKTSKESYGHLLAEFLWMQQISVTQKPPFDGLIDAIFTWQERRPQKQSFETDAYRNLPTHLQEGFESLLDPKERDPDFQAGMSQREVVQGPVPAESEAVLPSNVVLPSSAPEAPHQVQSAPPVVPSDSDVEIIAICPARRKRGALKIEPMVNAECKRIKQEHGQVESEPAAVKAEPVFCPQGHAMDWVEPRPVRTSPVKKQTHLVNVTWEAVTCDKCGANSATGIFIQIVPVSKTFVLQDRICETESKKCL